MSKGNRRHLKYVPKESQDFYWEMIEEGFVTPEDVEKQFKESGYTEDGEYPYLLDYGEYEVEEEYSPLEFSKLPEEKKAELYLKGLHRTRIRIEKGYEKDYPLDVYWQIEEAEKMLERIRNGEQKEFSPIQDPQKIKEVEEAIKYRNKKANETKKEKNMRRFTKEAVKLPERKDDFLGVFEGEDEIFDGYNEASGSEFQSEKKSEFQDEFQDEQKNAKKDDKKEHYKEMTKEYRQDRKIEIDMSFIDNMNLQYFTKEQAVNIIEFSVRFLSLEIEKRLIAQEIKELTAEYKDNMGVKPSKLKSMLREVIKEAKKDEVDRALEGEVFAILGSGDVKRVVDHFIEM